MKVFIEIFLNSVMSCGLNSEAKKWKFQPPPPNENCKALDQKIWHTFLTHEREHLCQISTKSVSMGLTPINTNFVEIWLFDVE